MIVLAARPGRAKESGSEKASRARGSSLLELVIAIAVLVSGLLAMSRSMEDSIDLGQTNRETALATAAARSMVERLYAADPARVFALYNDEPADDPDGSGTAPGCRFSVSELAPGAEQLDEPSGEILFPVSEDSPGELREDLEALRWAPLDLNLDGSVDGSDHSGDYRVVPVLVRITWKSAGVPREFELRTILGVR